MFDQRSTHSAASATGEAAPALPGGAVRSEFRCVVCGYGAIAAARPARCPMCGGHRWDLVDRHAWSDAA